MRDAGAWAIMTAYSKLNGTYCSAHPWLIGEVLKGEWSFDGVVISDWGGVNSVAAAARAGLDLEMPGPPDYFGEHLLEAVEAVEHLDDKALRVLRLARRTGALRGAPGPESSANEASDQRPVRRLGHESLVLLRNSGALPLAAEKLRSIAVIGPNAARTQIQGGGLARVNAPYAVSVLDGIRAAVAPDTEVVHAEGCSIDRFTRPLGRAEMRTPEGLPGARLDYLQGAERTLVRSETVDTTELTWIGGPLEEVPLHETSLRCSFTWSPASSGTYTLGLVAAGRDTVTIDGEVLLDSADAAPGGSHFFGRSTQELRRPLDVTAGREYAVVIDLETRTEKSATVGVRVGALPPRPRGSSRRR
ncbi:glycoside hydrolase family 3 C-terminal domain-containing protein [Micrococcales bacterium 31B]|nr:glycoside hydrolase family 3 C-terminal domain-containing protein [Micrococcales bacterium 31B]